MAVDIDIVSDLNGGDALPDGVVSANEGNLSTNRGSSDLGKADTAQPLETKDVAAVKPISLRDQISNALKGDTETPPAAQLDGGQVRNPDGTFAPKPAATTEAPAAAAPVVQYPTQGLPGLAPEVFAALPAETQQHVVRTMEALNQQAAQYQAVEQVIGPRRQGWAIHGMTDGAVLNQLFALSDFAEKDPQGFVRHFAQQRGIDLEVLAFGPEPTDPHVAATNTRIQQLEAQLAGFTAQQQQTQHNGIVQEIVNFADEKGADGKPLRPYFGELGNTVLPFIQASMARNPGKSRSEILSEAYDNACWGNPAIRAKVQAASNAVREAERLRGATEVAGRARKAGVSVSGGTPSDAAARAATSGSKGNLRDDIRAAMAASS